MDHPVIDSPRSVSLADSDPDDTGGMSKQEAEAQLKQLTQRLAQGQVSLYAARDQSVLIVLQGMDTSGKDGTIRHVFSSLNPAGCHVWSFKAPSEEEYEHDFLWRVHRRTPERGMIHVFNRSQYEDVLIARVHDLTPKEVWKKRYQQINDFERLLSDNGVLIFKFFLHISQDEQKRRLIAREEDREKAWKLSVADWKERAYWDRYIQAYEDALGKCGTAWAPWHIVPANKKWYRNYLVAHTLVEQLTPLLSQWDKELEARGKRALEELQAFHLQEQEQHDGHRPAKQKAGKKAR